MAAARAFLRSLDRGAPALIVAPSPGASAWLVADVLEADTACFGWRRRTLDTLADELALPVLAQAELVPIRRLGLEALCARVVHSLSARDALGRFSALRRRPGFVRALTSSLDELRLAGVDRAGLAAHDPDLAQILNAYVDGLAEAKLADRARVFEAATQAAKRGELAMFGTSLLALDVPILHAAEAEFALSVASAVTRACITVPVGDARTREIWVNGLAERLAEQQTDPSGDDELSRLQRRLFEIEPEAPAPVPASTDTAPAAPASGSPVQLELSLLSAPGEPRATRSSTIISEPEPEPEREPEPEPESESERESERIPTPTLPPRVGFASSPGESRECIEVARSILSAAESGVPFDRIAIAVRAVENYRAVLEEALVRARIPAHFADGVRRPAPEGRAFNALLTCAAEGLSARSFAEYLSIGVFPAAAEADPDAVTFVSPRRWERLLLDAAVVGGRARWTRRLAGLQQGMRDRLGPLAPDDPARERIEREIAQLDALKAFALPIIDALAALPRSAAWREWLAALESLARLSLRDPAAVCDTLAELAPLGPVGPVSLPDVRRLLVPRLRSVIVPSTGNGAGQVFVASIDELRGRSFARVFVIGLAEKVFPARIGEDPLLPDRIRRQLSPAPALTAERIARERLALRLAVGAASEHVVLSYPRFDLEHGRPRVPSFYGLEALQAICGELPAFDELARRADPGAAPRLGWPAPHDPGRAIDDAEYDVAILERWKSPLEPNVGAARYLLQANPHLARALRFRARRWDRERFVPADGFVVSTPAARSLLPAHALSRRAYSASALAQFAACPYKFYLSALMKLSAPERIAEVDELDPRQRGILFHAVQRELVAALSQRELVPLAEANLPAAIDLLSACLDRELARAREAYAPAIERVFDAALSSLRADLEGWLRALAGDRDWVPRHAEVEFGFAARRVDTAGEAVTRQPAMLLEQGLLLSGAIDLVEEFSAPGERGERILRATDHKTGAVSARLVVTRGGEVLQPVLYALALERLFPGSSVRAGRLHFCTARGRYEVQEVILSERAREIAAKLVRAISGMLDEGFLPAAPARDACEQCSYRVVCGPYEEERVASVKAKDSARLDLLNQLRDLP